MIPVKDFNGMGVAERRGALWRRGNTFAGWRELFFTHPTGDCQRQGQVAGITGL
jgi:hypothetical protein